MANPPHLTLIDGSGFIFRAYHRLPPLTDPEGTPVGAVFGFTAMLWNLIEAARKSPEDDYLAVILDAGKTSFRNELYPDYKANRPEPPEDLVPQFPLIRHAVAALGVPCIEKPNYEADDLIASYAEAAVGAGMAVTIVSSDKDLMQLVRPGLTLLDTMQNKRFAEAEVREKWGVPPHMLAEVLALMGDSVDNVPGVPGVGPKKAADLVNQFGDVEQVLASIDQVKGPKLKENLAAHADRVRLSRKLVELKRDVPLDPPLESLKLDHREDPEKLAAFLAKHGFRTLLARLGDAGKAAAATIAASDPDAVPGMAAPETVPIDHGAYETVTTPGRLDAWIDEARRLGVVGFDTETTSLDAVAARIVGFSLATVPGRACYVPLAHVSGEGLLAEPVAQIGIEAALGRLKGLLEDPAVLKVGQNLKYDMVVMAAHDIAIAPFDDTMLLSYALAGGLHGHGMDELSERHLGHTPIAYKDVTGSGKAQTGFAEVPLDKATAYAAEDADVTLRLHGLLRPRLWRERVTRVHEWCDRPLVPVLARMERRGVLVDRAELSRMSAEFAGAMERLEAEVHALAGEPFTLGSPKQLGEILFGKLGLPGGKKGKSGAWSTDVTELERLAEGGADIARLVLDWRQVQKLRSTYTEALQQQINPQTGRVHTSFSMAATSTGRLASTDPNLQNIPIRTEMGRRIRDAFVAPPGHVIMAADYNQIELRLMAHIADVPELKDAYNHGVDIHSLTARQIFGLTPDAPVDRELRARAKTINFSIIYGISAFGLAQRLGIARGEAQAFIERYLDHYHGIRRYMAETVARVREDAFVTTLLGRRIHVPMIRSKVQSERAGAERAAINAPVQGTAADIIKRAMVRMEPALAEAGLTGVRMLLQVHDELVFEVPEADVDKARDVIRNVMESAAGPALELSVPLGVEIGTGPNWGAAH
ncbi:DNA polymerase I [Sandaracinobacteroides sp. A072]|uniref:DNA polymerase I n=1 Tax=Sandaracinobacteroides sp. A072 TaxID=3461146 RepID=UPI0040422C79